MRLLMYIVNAWWIGANQAFIMFRNRQLESPQNVLYEMGYLVYNSQMYT